MARNCVAFVCSFSVFRFSRRLRRLRSAMRRHCSCHRLTLSPFGHLFIYEKTKKKKSWGKSVNSVWQLPFYVWLFFFFGSPFFIFIFVANNFSPTAYLIPLSHAMPLALHLNYGDDNAFESGFAFAVVLNPGQKRNSKLVN